MERRLKPRTARQGRDGSEARLACQICFHSSSYFVPRSSSRATRRGLFFSSAFRVPSGMGAVERVDELSDGQNIGPSSEASAASQSCSRRLTVFSGIGFAPEVVDVRAIRFEPGGVALPGQTRMPFASSSRVRLT
jgi:hypothetical protein